MIVWSKHSQLFRFLLTVFAILVLSLGGWATAKADTNSSFDRNPPLVEPTSKSIKTKR